MQRMRAYRPAGIIKGMDNFILRCHREKIKTGNDSNRQTTKTMKYNYLQVIDHLALAFNGLEHLEETELSEKVKAIIKELEDLTEDMCSCGDQIHPDGDGYCSDCA